MGNIISNLEISMILSTFMIIFGDTAGAWWNPSFECRVPFNLTSSEDYDNLRVNLTYQFYNSANCSYPNKDSIAIVLNDMGTDEEIKEQR